MNIFKRCNHNWELDCEKEKNEAFSGRYFVRVYICQKCGKIKRVEV